MSGYNYYSLKKCRCYQPINKKLLETGIGGEVVPVLLNVMLFDDKKINMKYVEICKKNLYIFLN